MPNSVTAKTESVPKYPLTKILIVWVVAVIAVVVGLLSFGGRFPSNRCGIKLPDGGCVRLETVSTPEALSRGLSGHAAIEADHGMLFDFGAEGRPCMWMKDMRFSLDIIWLNDDKEIVEIKRGITPETYPKSFCADEAARYVIEVNAGVADNAGLKVGQTLSL